jgi:molecular chaperone DnaK
MRIGFDFGTTNTVVATVVGNDVRVALSDGKPFPSAIAYTDGSPIIGEAAIKLMQAPAPSYSSLAFIRSPKMLLTQDDYLRNDSMKDSVETAKDVIQHIGLESLRELFSKEKRMQVSSESDLLRDVEVVATVPVHWTGATRRRLRKAFSEAGFGRVVRIIHEPFAALYGFLRSNPAVADDLNQRIVAVVDWGGGTLDLTLCRIQDGKVQQVGSAGTDECGGDKFDDALADWVIAREQEGQNRNDFPSRHAKMRLVAECELVKKELSNVESQLIMMSDFGDTVLRTVTRSILDHCTKGLIDLGIDRFNALMAAHGVHPSELGLCLFTGGMSNVPSLVQRLQEMFGTRLRRTGNGASAIAEGAAWFGRDEGKLFLSRPIELEIAAVGARQYHTLIPKDTEIPMVGAAVAGIEWELWCVAPGTRFAVVRIATPVISSLEATALAPRRCVGDILVPVNHKLEPFEECIRVRAELSGDLALSVRAKADWSVAPAPLELNDLEFSAVLPATR